MRIVDAVMRYYSLLFHFLLALFMLAVAVVSWASGGHRLRVWVLPWEGETLSYSLLGLALAGLLILWLAVKRTLPILFLLWSLAVLAAFLRGFFLSPYHFRTAQLWVALILSGAALLAAVGGWLQFRGRKRAAARY